jgi:hypothetical protein
MPWWWKKKRPSRPTLSITPRSEGAPSSKVNLSQLAPPLADYLAGVAVLQQALASHISTLSGSAWGSRDADDLAVVAGYAMDRFRAFRKLLGDYEEDLPHTLATPRERLAGHLQRLDTPRWYEGVGTALVLTGFTRDFWHLLAEGFSSDIRDTIQQELSDKGDEDLLVGVLERFLASDARYTARLSLWCRRLVGDTILVCRDALSQEAMDSDEAEIRLEPALSDVVANHTRRLDRLGLTA